MAVTAPAAPATVAGPGGGAQTPPPGWAATGCPHPRGCGPDGRGRWSPVGGGPPAPAPLHRRATGSPAGGVP
ncbi:hypothetical protein B7R87_32735 [Streptomyces tsukubensis]|nr:hypothetical protein B7R87_32735 [Streptomyces tsukubensis]